MKRTKRVMSVLLVTVMVLGMSMSAYAAEKEDILPEKGDYVLVNGTEIVYVGEDYENPETGEYIRWSNSRGTDKKFTFRIQYSVTSSKFKVNGDKVKVTANAHIEDRNFKTVDGYDGHLYSVSLNGIYSRTLQFSVGSTQSGTIDGLKNGGKYSVTIINNDYLDVDKYLVGDGKIESL